jgi:hypothetical protein
MHEVMKECFRRAPGAVVPRRSSKAEVLQLRSARQAHIANQGRIWIWSLVVCGHCCVLLCCLCTCSLVIFCWQIWSLDVDVFSFFPPSTLKLVQFEQSECSDCRGASQNCRGVLDLGCIPGCYGVSLRSLMGFLQLLQASRSTGEGRGS